MRLLIRLFSLVLLMLLPLRGHAAPVLAEYLPKVPAAELVQGADAYGPIRDDIPVAPVMRAGKLLGYAFITSDFVGTSGYSGKPIHTMVALSPEARVLGVQLVKHSEPIVLIGIPEAKMRGLAADYIGMDLVAEAASGGTSHELNIISGATVTVMVIDDSIVRSGLQVAKTLGLGGLAADQPASGPVVRVNPDATAAPDWATLEGDGSLRRMALTVGDVNADFQAHADPRAARRALTEPPETEFITMFTALVSQPGIGRSLLGASEYGNLANWLKDGDNAILIAGDGLYSFKGSGYVRGGIFDRIVLIQDDLSVRFHDRDHRRTTIAAEGHPDLREMDLFRIPADSGFDPARPFRLQLLVQREVAAIEKVFLTYDLAYALPEKYLITEAPPPAPETPDAAADPVATAAQLADRSESEAQAALWKKIWLGKKPEVAGLAVMLAVLTLAFFGQEWLSRSERAVSWFRKGYLLVTLVFLGWYANAQLSVVNLMALAASLGQGFSWQAFLLDPLTFILWFSVAAALIFWGRGAFCGWLCPFGALQELTNNIAKALRIPQITVPWLIHERLWPVKYIIFLGLFGVSLASMELAEKLAEIEPFKTAIILKFSRAWPFVTFALGLLFIGLFIERFYCRYLCPLGAALAIPARIRMFDWLKRYKECGNPCQTCGNECMVQAIHPTGEINPNECLNCMHCQVLYHSTVKCPVVIRQLKRRSAVGAAPGRDRDIMNHPNLKEKIHD